MTDAPEIKKEQPVMHLHVDKIDEISEYIAAIQAPNAHRNRYDTSIPFLIVPEGLKVLDLESHMPNPSRIRKHVKMTDAPSFISYVNKFKVGTSPVSFAKQGDAGLTIMTVFDYDAPNMLVPASDDKPERMAYGLPQWNNHVVQLDLTFSPDYALLRHYSDKWFGQQEFAEFIEDNRHIFSKPDSAFMFELAQDLNVKVESSLRSTRRLSNGQIGLQYVEVVNGTTTHGDEVIIPEMLEFTTNIYEGLPAEKLMAVFRFRKDGTDVKFKYKLMTKLQERQAHGAVRSLVEQETDIRTLSVSTLALC